MHDEKGFHGTLEYRAKSILKCGFIHSTKNTEWLGHGVYFFTDLMYARKWALQESEKPQNNGAKEVVLKADISCKNENFCDLDLEENMSKLLQERKRLLLDLKGKSSNKFSDAEMRCIVCNWFAQKYGIKVFAYTFPIRLHNKCGFPYIEEQRQLCVNDDSCIHGLGRYKEEEGFCDAI